ncbi:MAG TPA: hypothetical protein VK635_31185 [Bradyrhizobium sp.]|jgi:hypothetical protein|nr:hypothetical protein [Bradyrhizobium sp.]
MDFLSLKYGFCGIWFLGVPLNVKNANREGACHAKELVDDLAPNEDTARLIGCSFLRVI